MKPRACLLAPVLLALVACDPEGLGRSNPDFLVIGHRGAPNDAAENTIPSFEVAVAVGANALELDVCVTSDRVLVVWHDADPDGTQALARQAGAARDDDVVARIQHDATRRTTGEAAFEVDHEHASISYHASGAQVRPFRRSAG